MGRGQYEDFGKGLLGDQLSGFEIKVTQVHNAKKASSGGIAAGANQKKFVIKAYERANGKLVKPDKTKNTCK